VRNPPNLSYFEALLMSLFLIGKDDSTVRGKISFRSASVDPSYNDEGFEEEFKADVTSLPHSSSRGRESPAAWEYNSCYTRKDIPIETNEEDSEEPVALDPVEVSEPLSDDDMSWGSVKMKDKKKKKKDGKKAVITYEHFSAS
jgi:hypothetical protein